MMPRFFLLPALLLGTLAAGCAHAPPRPAAPAPARETEKVTTPPPTKLVMEPIKLQAVKGPAGTDLEVLDADSLFERASALLSAKRYREAAGLYQQLMKLFPESRYASPTLYNTGLCFEWLGEFDKAAAQYRELIRRFGATPEAVDAAFRLGGAYAELQNWAASAQVFQVLLGRKDLSASDRIEALARKGLAHFRLGDARSCKSTLDESLRFHKSVETVERLDTDFFLAMAAYYLAALPHQEFRNVKVDAGGGLARTLDEKARLLLLSQAGYIRAINVKNPYWATASGFQIGSLYREFYTVLLTTLPDFSQQAAKNARLAKVPPEQARKQLVQVYMEEVHKAVKPLLTKAIRVFEKNVLMAERVGVQSNWIGKSRRQIQELKHLLLLPPAEAVDLVLRDKTLPEDRPEAAPAVPDSPAQSAPDAPASSRPSGPGAPAAPAPPGTPDAPRPAPAAPSAPPSPRGPAAPELDEPGRAVL